MRDELDMIAMAVVALILVVVLYVSYRIECKNAKKAVGIKDKCYSCKHKTCLFDSCGYCHDED